TGAIPGAYYYYAPASEEILARTKQIEDICQRYETPLPAAALQFLLANPVVSAIIPGAIKPDHVNSNIALLDHTIPADLWAELKSVGILDPSAPTP
ncbi:MAG: aldo/keto reductase, partial [Chloroflexota bacterium]